MTVEASKQSVLSALKNSINTLKDPVSKADEGIEGRYRLPTPKDTGARTHIYRTKG